MSKVQSVSVSSRPCLKQQVLHFPIPAAGQRTLPCSCGQQTGYRELRSKPVLTVVGQVEVSRPYYLCPHCHAGQFPADLTFEGGVLKRIDFQK